MSKIGDGYGSEWHLLRYLGYHRDALDKAVLGATGGSAIQWLDFPVTNGATRDRDAEWEGMDFVTDKTVRGAWARFWPQRGKAQNWDAVGRLCVNGHDEWLLVEAKGHLAELKSTCGASAKGGLNQIRKALGETIAHMGATATVGAWLKPYYQYANRLAALYFLAQQKVEARLLCVCFLGDRWPKGHKMADQVRCPRTPDAWNREFDAIDAHLGLTANSPLKDRVHHVHLRAIGPG